MRRFILATVFGLALATPSFAADTDAAAPSITETAAAAATATPNATSDVQFARDFRRGRPSMLPAMYTMQAVLQGYDAFSTMTALKRGGREANPAMQAIVQHPTAFIAMKAGITAASIMAAEQMWKANHRLAAIGLMVASNAMMSAVAANNHKVLASLK